MDTKGGKWRGGGMMNWEIGIDIYTLICITWITNKKLLYKKINKIKFQKKCVFYTGWSPAANISSNITGPFFIHSNICVFISCLGGRNIHLC